MGGNVHGNPNDGEDSIAAKLAPKIIVQFWNGSNVLIKQAVQEGYGVVNSTKQFTYLDYSDAKISLAKIYGFDPIPPELTGAETQKILGLGCQMWGEWIPTVPSMEQRVYPRIAAGAEVGWTPLSQKDYQSFEKRLPRQLKRWDVQGINYSKSFITPVTPDGSTANPQLK